MASYEDDLSAPVGSSWTDELTNIRAYIAEKANEHVALPKEPINIVATDVARWLIGLPLALREVYYHLYAEDCSQREAAALMHVSQPRVAQLHQQLLRLGRRDLAGLND